MPSVTCLRLSDVSSVICRVTYFFHVGPEGCTPAYWFTQYRTSYVAENVGMYLFLYAAYNPGE